jgi:hypothetical protein
MPHSVEADRAQPLRVFDGAADHFEGKGLQQSQNLDVLAAVRPDALSPYSFRNEKSNGFCHPASIPTYLSFLGCHNWSQIRGVPDGQMALYGIAEG